MIAPYDTRLPADLADLKVQIEGYAGEYGLDFYETIFEVVDAEDLNEIAAYGGFPTRYPHWSFGMQFEELKKGYDYGLSKIYEMVINNDPCYAYLMRCNHTIDQKLVMAHVYGHCDFFKNNAYFDHTSRKMMDEMANHGMRIRRYVEKYGEDEVEAFLDKCMSVDDLIDIHSTAIKRRDEVSKYDFNKEKEEEVRSTRFKSKAYMDDYINPPDVLKAEEDEHRKKQENEASSFPENPEKDVLLFLIKYAPMKPWQRDVLSIVRDEAYYFTPQGQTKIANEGWACTVAGTLVFTDQGILPIEEIVENREACRISDGEQTQHVYDWATFENRRTVRVRTRRGLVLEGSETHRLQLPDGSWKRLDELHVGDTVNIGGGQNLWAMQQVPITWEPKQRLTLANIAEETGVDIETVIRHRRGTRGRHAETLAPFVEQYDSDLATMTMAHNKRQPIRVPEFVNEELAAILGYLTGDGHISERKRVIGLTTGDIEQADRFTDLIDSQFDIVPRQKLDENRWRVQFSSQTATDFFKHLGMATGVAARKKTVPDVILRSPKLVVASFLRAYFDCDGYAGDQGVILSTASTKMAETVQLLLMNFGILSRRRQQPDECWHVHITGASAMTFRDEIGFGLTRKQDSLDNYLEGHSWFKTETWTDEIVTIEQGQANVYDISVEDTHRYAAAGFINHNSYWHSTIMTQRCLTGSEMIDYADHHSGTMASSGRLNPYKLGIELLRDIEHRWNTGKFGKEYEECDDLEKRRKWDKQLGLGRQKIFEVRRIYNDITFIDSFLTPEFCVQHNLFSFAYDNHAGQYFIESREFAKIKQRLLFSLTNFGKPWIYVHDGNYRNRGELLLRHEFNGIDLRLDWAADVLENLHHIWSRPVHLQTVVEDRPTLLSYDGASHSMKPLGDADDPRKDDSDKPF